MCGRWSFGRKWVGGLALAAALVVAQAASDSRAPKSGTDVIWRPQRDGKDLRLQDFCVFELRGKVVVAAMMKDFCDEGIAIGVSDNLIPVLSGKTPGPVRIEHKGTALEERTREDRSMVWAPHVVQSGGAYYMFYTGVTTPSPGQWCQRILVACSATPEDPKSWKRNSGVQFAVEGNIQNWFRPSHINSVWSDSSWADCRDPMVFEKNGTWYLLYTGRDKDAGICGVATARSVLGPWQDRGAVLKMPSPTIPESCFVLEDSDGGYVITFNHAAGGGGSKIARGKSLVPVAAEPCFSAAEISDNARGLKGWAHEFLPLGNNRLLAAYLTGYFVNFAEWRLEKGTNGWALQAHQ